MCIRFVGPCSHGRDPYTRCDDGCVDLVERVTAAERKRCADIVEGLLKEYAAELNKLSKSEAGWGFLGEALDRITEASE